MGARYIRYSPGGTANIPKSREREGEFAVGGRTVTAASSGIIELGCPPSGANVKITTAERLAGL